MLIHMQAQHEHGYSGLRALPKHHLLSTKVGKQTLFSKKFSPKPFEQKLNFRCWSRTTIALRSPYSRAAACCDIAGGDVKHGWSRCARIFCRPVIAPSIAIPTR